MATVGTHGKTASEAGRRLLASAERKQRACDTPASIPHTIHGAIGLRTPRTRCVPSVYGLRPKPIFCIFVRPTLLSDRETDCIFDRAALCGATPGVMDSGSSVNAQAQSGVSWASMAEKGLGSPVGFELAGIGAA